VAHERPEDHLVLDLRSGDGVAILRALIKTRPLDALQGNRKTSLSMRMSPLLILGLSTPIAMATAGAGPGRDLTALMAVYATTMALFHRERAGEGQVEI
jgi:hypothetical protein